jgi:type I restriction enzyme S subunit
MNETLEAMARAIFKSWFVDFDPVRAKAEGRRPVGMDEETAKLFPDGFVDSELGKIPKGWRVGRLSDLCSTQYGYTASANDIPIGPKFLRVKDINKLNWIEWDTVPFCEINDEDKLKYNLKVGDIVVARMADPGKSAIIEQSVDAVFASYLVRLKTISLGYAYYIYSFLKSPLYGEYIEGSMSGSVQANMNAKVIVAALLVIPSTEVVDAFLNFVLPLRKKLVTNVSESQTLANIRDTLLPKLLSGKIRIKDAEKLLAR